MIWAILKMIPMVLGKTLTLTGQFLDVAKQIVTWGQ